MEDEGDFRSHLSTSSASLSSKPQGQRGTQSFSVLAPLLLFLSYASSRCISPLDGCALQAYPGYLTSFPQCRIWFGEPQRTELGWDGCSPRPRPSHVYTGGETMGSRPNALSVIPSAVVSRLWNSELVCLPARLPALCPVSHRTLKLVLTGIWTASS